MISDTITALFKEKTKLFKTENTIKLPTIELNHFNYGMAGATLLDPDNLLNSGHDYTIIPFYNNDIDKSKDKMFQYYRNVAYNHEGTFDLETGDLWEGRDRVSKSSMAQFKDLTVFAMAYFNDEKSYKRFALEGYSSRGAIEYVRALDYTSDTNKINSFSYGARRKLVHHMLSGIGHFHSNGILRKSEIARSVMYSIRYDTDVQHFYIVDCEKAEVLPIVAMIKVVRKDSRDKITTVKPYTLNDVVTQVTALPSWGFNNL